MLACKLMMIGLCLMEVWLSPLFYTY